MTRGFNNGSMIVDSGALTLDKITLDGASTATAPLEGIADGGIVKVAGPVRLTVNSGATLQNSAVTGDDSEVTGNGGAIYLTSGASLTMGGTIENCSAANGGGVYAENGFTTITTTGTITGCKATSGNGGAIYASTGTSVNLNAGTALTDNAAKANGGAVYTEANLILRGTVNNNEATVNGGGVYMGGSAMFTMYAGSEISHNTAANGGGLATGSTARIAGGNLEYNSAIEQGGAVYAAETANVTISGTTALTQNEAKQGGAVYNGGSLTMTGGSMTGNSASENGGAVYVADEKTFTMSGGSIRENSSPEGAVSTGNGAVLAFTGNVVIRGNTGTDGETAMNVYLGYDSNGVITTSGLGNSADIGVYVADGEPEDASVPDRVDNPIYCEHGLSARNFGTYTGSNISGARLNKFVNDRDTSLTGMGGAEITGSGYFVTWSGKGLQLVISKVESNGETTVAGGISFTLTNSDGVRVWSGRSAVDGLVSIPWGPEERANGNVATFAPKSSYTLRQTAANADTVRPAGTWRLTIGRDNEVIWEVITTEEESVDRTIDITAAGQGSKAYLGETFRLYNDTRPKLTYHANGGKLLDGTSEEQRTDTIDFAITETSHRYTIKETNPIWDSHVFKYWATLEEEPTGEDDELNDDELAAQGYFKYEQNDSIVFFRGTEEQENTRNSSKGDLTLYAQWDEVVCKVTDRSGTLLYLNGSPAVYGALEDCFVDYNAANAYSFTYANGVRATARMIEMLIPTYTLNAPVELARGKTVMLTTAPTTDMDGYAYTGDAGTACVITRGEGCNTSMITNRSNLSLMNITLDGGAGNDTDPVVCDGGIVNNAQTSAVLTIQEGAILCNSSVVGNGGAVNAIAGTTVYLNGGTLQSNTAKNNGGAVNAIAGTTVYLNGGTLQSNTAKNNGGAVYAEGATVYMTGSMINGNTAANGAGIYLADGTDATKATLNMSGGTLQNNTAEGNGGAVYAGQNASVTISGGTLQNNTASSGGAIYTAEDGIVDLTGGTISDNIAANGAGIYGSTLNLSGNPSFAGNFSTAVLLDDAKNGGEDYTVARQDIYITGTGNPHSSIQVTGPITSGDGTIWVWAEKQDHYEMLKQFAIFYGNGTSLSDPVKESTMRAFRNAQPDSLTICGGEYLTGQKGEEANWIYWTGGFDVVFLKTDAYGGWKKDAGGNMFSEGLPGATFTLYSDPDCTTPFEMTFSGSKTAEEDGKRATTTSSDGTATYKDKNGVTVTLEKGEVLLSKVPPKTFYLKETTPATGYNRIENEIPVNESTVYQVIISDKGELKMLKKGVDGTYGTEVFKEKRREVTADGTPSDLTQYVVINIPEAERKVILRKVAQTTYESRKDAKFEIFYYDGTPYLKGADAEGKYTSGASGVYFIDKLPYGKYYLHETTPNNVWFTLTVGDDTLNSDGTKEIAPGSRDGVTVQKQQSQNP